MISPFLHHIDQLGLQIDNSESIDSLKQFLSMLNILQMTENIWLIIDSGKFNGIKDIQSLLELSNNIYSLGICSKYNCLKEILDQIFDGLNIHIKQFKIKTDNFNFMKWIIQRIQNLQSIQFIYYYSLTNIWKELIEWLTLSHVQFHSEQDQYSLTISFQNNH
jgi:hypothetical protein